jgi:predicted transcriptional regulator
MTATVKEQVLEMIRKLPDESTVSDIMAELYFRKKVDEGLRELEQGETLEHDEVPADLVDPPDYT